MLACTSALKILGPTGRTVVEWLNGAPLLKRLRAAQLWCLVKESELGLLRVIEFYELPMMGSGSRFSNG